MSVQIFNTLTGQKEVFTPLEEGKVKKCMFVALPFTIIVTLVTPDVTWPSMLYNVGCEPTLM